MVVSFERTGGFAGLSLSTKIDSHNLDVAEANRLEDEVRQAGFFNLPAKLIGTGGGADRFEYQIEVEVEGRRHSVSVGEAAVPDSLRPLVEHLELLMRTRRSPKPLG